MHREGPQMQTTIKSHQEQGHIREESVRHRISICRELCSKALNTIAKWFLAFKIQRKKSEQGW